MTTEVVQREHDKEQNGNVATAERTHGSTFRPRFDIWETEHELVLCGDMPGVSPADLEVRFENKELTIHGKAPARHQDVEMLYSEYGVGDFYRSFTIGEAIDTEKISAEMKDGVLTLHLPKAEAVKPRRIEIKGG